MSRKLNITGDRSVPDWRTEPTLSVDRLAAVLGVGRSVVYAMAAADEIPTIRVGKRLLIPTHAALSQFKLLPQDAA